MEESSSLVRFVFLLCLVSSSVFCLDDSDQNATVSSSSAVYIVTLKEPPSVHSSSGRETDDSNHSLTSTSSQIYRTSYVPKSYLLLVFFFMFATNVEIPQFLGPRLLVACCSLVFS